MKVYPDKLDQQLASGIAPIYMVHGDEPLQLGEMADRLRAHAREHGCEERDVVIAESEDDWARLVETGASMSLFAALRLVELRLPTGKPGKTGGETIRRWAQNPPPDVVLLITSARPDRSGLASAWYKSIEKVGVVFEVYPVTVRGLPDWLSARLARHALHATPEAVALIAERVEGNLLAAAQEVERLSLLFPGGGAGGQLDSDAVLASVADSSRYSIPDLVAASLNGDGARALRILRGLAATNEPPVLVLWALNQEIRAGARVAEAQAAGAGLAVALKGAGVWPKRQPALKLALSRHEPAGWLTLVRDVARLDRMIKGQEPGDVWNTFESLCAALAGVPRQQSVAALVS